MYDMYPENWVSGQEPRPTEPASTPARRRVRREHRILPVVVEPSVAGHRRSDDQR